jgi:CO dehydrogenase maturation factor
MSYTIAVCGKGGTGKTTFSAFLIKYLREKNKGSILAIDADPSANLGSLLGLDCQTQIVNFLDEMVEKTENPPAGMTKDRYIQYRVQEAVCEGDGFDLLTMGRPEGPGCYCFANSILRTVIEKLSKGYDFVVIDNEAGMEHLSRRTMRQADLVFLLSDASIAGLRVAKKIFDLSKELKLKFKDTYLVINRASNGLEELKKQAQSSALNLLGSLPTDKRIMQSAIDGQALLKIKESLIAYHETKKILEKIAWPWN